MKTSLTLIFSLLYFFTGYSQFCDTALYDSNSTNFITYHFDDSIGYDFDTTDFIYLGWSNFTPLEIDISNSGIWEIGTPQKGIDFDSSYSGNKVIITDSVSPYPIGNHSFFDVKVKPAITASLRFKYKMDSDTLLDGGYITVSYDNGGSWDNIVNVDYSHPNYGFMEVCPSYSDTLTNGQLGISGAINDWTEFVLYDALFAIKSLGDTVIYRFHFVSDSVETNKKGWMIDDIETFGTMIPGSIKEEDLNKLSIYPNPTVDEISLDFYGNEGQLNNLEVKIISIWGQVIKEIDLHSLERSIQVGELPSGVYFVNLIKDGVIIATSRFVKAE